MTCDREDNEIVSESGAYVRKEKTNRRKKKNGDEGDTSRDKEENMGGARNVILTG